MTIWRVASIVLASITLTTAQQVLPLVVADETALQHGAGRLYYQEHMFDGVAIRHLHNGITEYAHYRNGLLHGNVHSIYPNGQTHAVRVYLDGKKSGQHRGWWPNGQLEFDYLFEADRHHGPALSWYQNGQIAASFNYQQGHEQGLQQMWQADGNLRLRYEMRDNRRYGWMGSKLCKD